MPVLFRVRQNKNNKMQSCFGKWYARIVALRTLSYRDLIQHIADHNTVYGRDVCQGVALKLQDCILELLMDGNKVQFGELGTFYLSATSNGADDEEKFNAGTDIKGLYLRFAPSRLNINDLSSKTLKKKAQLKNVKELNPETPSSNNNG